MHGCLRCLKILYIHNCWNLFFVPEPLWNSDYHKLSNFRIDFFYRSVISPFAVKFFLLLFTSHCSPVTSSNLRNQALLFMELCLLQGTDLKNWCSITTDEWWRFENFLRLKAKSVEYSVYCSALLAFSFCHVCTVTVE